MTHTPKKSNNIQRIPLRLFIPWDEHGRIVLQDGSIITPDTKIVPDKGTKVIKLPDGIFLKSKK